MSTGQPTGRTRGQRPQRTSRAPRASPVLILTSIVLLLGACATMEKLSLALSDTTQERPVRFGSPDSTALVVIETRVLFDPSRTLSFDSLLDDIFGRSDDTADLRRAVLVDSAGSKLRGVVLADSFENDLVFFSNLAPGNYALSTLVAYFDLNEDQRDEYYDWQCNVKPVTNCPDGIELHFVPPADAGDFRFTLAGGDLVYLGPLTLTENDRPPYGNYEGAIDRSRIAMQGDACEIAYSPQAEFEALVRITKEHGDHPWMDRCRTRMAELKAAHQATTTAASSAKPSGQNQEGREP